MAADDAGTFRVQPHNIEAEQAILGAILVNNEAFHRVSELLRPEHFFEPVHGRIYECCAQRIGRGQRADPVTLKLLFEEDEALRELDGARYLTASRMPPRPSSTPQYGQIVHDLALLHGLIEWAEDLVSSAYDRVLPESGRDQIEMAERDLFALAQEKDPRRVPGVPTSSLGRDPAHRERLAQGRQGVGRADQAHRPRREAGRAAAVRSRHPGRRPSMGKTAMAVTIAANAAAAENVHDDAHTAKHRNFVVGVFSLEMSAEQLATRLLSGKGRIESDRLRRGDISEAEWPTLVRASQDLGSMPLFIDDTPALSIGALRTRARRLQRTQGLHLLVVDYLQLLRGSGQNSQSNRVQEITEITQGLKAMAKELNVPVLALSQLSRAVESREDKRPMLSDLRESGSIEQDADVVMFVFREEYYLSRAIPTQREGEGKDKFDLRYQDWFQRCQAVHNKAEIIIAKQRHGPIGNIQVQFDANLGQFNDLEPGHYPEHLYG